MVAYVSNKLIDPYFSYEFKGINLSYFSGFNLNFANFMNSYYDSEITQKVKEGIMLSVFDLLDTLPAEGFLNFERDAKSEIELHQAKSYVKFFDLLIAIDEKTIVMENAKFLKKMYRGETNVFLYEFRVDLKAQTARQFGLNELYQDLLKTPIVYRGLFLTGENKVHFNNEARFDTVKKYFICFFNKGLDIKFYNESFNYIDNERSALRTAVHKEGDDLNV